jgi:DNA-binding LacI/PurR family transcriptional regulator
MKEKRPTAAVQAQMHGSQVGPCLAGTVQQKRPKRVRIIDVASEAGVSKSTVSIAFNSPERLSAETRARIHSVADLLGYRPHPVARMLAQRHTKTLGILTPQALAVAFGNPFFSMFSQGVASVAEEYGYGLLFVSPLRGSLARAAGRASVDGFVALGLGEEHPEVEQIRNAGLPIVLVDSSAFPEHGSIEVEDESGAHAAAEHLLSLGHREFLVLAVEPPTFARGSGNSMPILEGVNAQRMRGYRRALEAEGVVLEEERILTGPASFAGGREAFDRALATGLQFTAVLAMSDAMAIGALHAAHEHGLSVPRDVSLVGFDNIDEAEHTHPPLTTVHQPVREKGAEAARLLLSAVDHRDLGQPEHRRLETRLILRGSTSQPGPRRQEVTQPD